MNSTSPSPPEIVLPAGKEHFTVKEAADLANREERWLRGCLKAGRLAGVELNGGRWFLSRAAVLDLLGWPRKRGISGQRAAAAQKAQVSGQDVNTILPAVAFPKGTCTKDLPPSVREKIEEIQQRKSQSRKRRIVRTPKERARAKAIDAKRKRIASERKAFDKKLSQARPKKSFRRH